MLKEEGEITDDEDDKQMSEKAETPSPVKDERRHVSNRKRSRTSDRNRHMKRPFGSQKSYDRISSSNGHGTKARSVDLTESPAKKSKPDLTTSPPLSCAPLPPGSVRSMLPPLLARPQYQPRAFYSYHPRFTKNVSGNCGFDKQKSASSDSRAGSDMEIITIDDDDLYVDLSSDESVVVAVGVKQEDEDLDELQLRREALNSAVRCSKVQTEKGTLFDVGASSLSTSESQRRDHTDSGLNSINGMNSSFVPCSSNNVQSSGEENLCANDSTGVNGDIVPVTSSAICWADDQLTSNRPEHLPIMSLSPQRSAATISSEINAELHASPPTDSTYINSALETANSSMPVHEDIHQAHSDNYDQVEMELDSGNESENPVISSGENMRRPSNTPEHNYSPNQYTSTSLVGLKSSASTDSVPLLMPKSCDNSESQSSLSHTTAGDSNALNQLAESTEACTVYDVNVPAVLHADSDLCNSHSLQQQRKVQDADTKSELLLRAALLESLNSSKRQQQLDTVSSISRDRTKAATVTANTRSTKRTVTSTSGNPLPVHPEVVISLTGESSDSDDAEHLEVPDSNDRSSATALDTLAGTGNSLDRVDIDRFLREMRQATEEPKPQDSDTAPFSQNDALSGIKYKKVHSTAEPQCMLSNNVSLPFPACSKTLLAESPKLRFRKGIGDAAQLTVKDNLLLKDTICTLERKLSCERRYMQQQKIAMSKAKLKMARKKEQVGAAQKRVKKLREQLAAAERIAVSSKKQLDNLQQEMLTLSRGVEQHQKTVDELEAELHIAQKNCGSSANNNVFSSQSSLLKTSPVNHHLTDIKVARNWGSGTMEGTKSFLISGANGDGDAFHCVTVADISDQHLFTSPSSQNTAAADLINVKQNKVHSTRILPLTAKANTSHRLRKLRQLNAAGGCKSGIDTVSAKSKLLVRELAAETKGDKIEHGHSVEQTMPCSASSAVLAVAEEPSVSHIKDSDLSPVTKPRISVAKSDVLTAESSRDVADDICDTSASLNEFTMPSDRKMKQILHYYNSILDKNSSSTCILAPSSQLFVSDPMLSFQFPANATMPVSASFLAVDSKPDAREVGDYCGRYHSSLLCFRSYRFSDYYYQKEGLGVTSETYSHKLDCCAPLCQYDLMGKCHDDNCPWQHRSDYSLSRREHLVDVLSYCPSVAGIDRSTPSTMYEQQLSQYVDAFLKDTCAQLPYSEQCLRLIRRVKTAAGFTRPHAVCTSARSWKLRSGKQYSTSGDRNDFLFSSDDVSKIHIPEPAVGCLATGDVRYWMVAESDQIQNLEEAVTNMPTDDSLWIKLAYAKMMEMKWSASHDECISYGLNVLARAVEANPSNSKLWQHYLDLYTERSDAEIDVSALYEQAIQYAPSYEFFWKYLQLPASSYSDKMDICKRLRQYLCSPRCRDDADTRSHHLLETVLFQSALCTASGRFKDGLQVIQAIVQSKASVIWLWLTPCDRIVMWLSFVHLYECRQLPQVLFDPANSSPGPVVRKEAFVVPFRVGTKTRILYETLLQLFQSAFSACEKDSGEGTGSREEYLQWIGALFRSHILLELSCHGWLAARLLCQQILQRRPYLIDIWLFLVQLIVAGRKNTADGHDVVASVSDTVDKALSGNPHAIELYLAGASALVECGDTEGALTFAERCPISLFEVDQLDSTSVDPNLLYCSLLGQTLPLGYKSPVMRSSVSPRYVADQQANLWLCYCLLLDLQGAHDQAAEAYHLALGCATRTEDIRRLWLAFLRRSVALVSGQLPWLSPPASSDHRSKLWQEFESDVDRALASIPVRRSLPHSDQTWDDYSYHNEVVRLHVSCISDPDVVRGLYEKYLRRMPGNVELVLTAIEYLSSRGKDSTRPGLGLCLVALHSCPRSAMLWNTALRLSQRMGNVNLVRSLYAKATATLPFDAGLWKMYIAFEVINGCRGHVQEALDECRRLQVNLAGFLDTLLK